MLQTLARLILKALGWQLIEPADRPARMLILAYPHTSNWDGFYTLLTGLGLGLRAHWAAKDSLFFWPIGGLLQRLGGIPVHRRPRTGFVGQVGERFARDPHSIKDQTLAAWAVPEWVWPELDFGPEPAGDALKYAWLRSLQKTPPLWLRARPGTATALGRRLGHCGPADTPLAPDALR